MESSLFGRMFKGIFKFFFSSILLGLIGVIASTSLMTGKFPPEWKQIKNTFGTIQRLRDIQKTALKASSGGGGLDASALAGGAGSRSFTGVSPAKAASSNKVVTNDDPEIADIKDLVKQHENMRNLAASLNGDSDSEVGTIPTQQSVHNNASVNANMENRLRSLETQVANLTANFRNLTVSISDINSKLDRISKTKK